MSIKSIYQTEFYNHSPVPNWSFDIDFGVLDNVNKELNQSIVSVNWGEKPLQKIQTHHKGIQMFLPGRRESNNELAIVFNENSDYPINKQLELLFPHNQDYLPLGRDKDSNGNENTNYYQNKKNDNSIIKIYSINPINNDRIRKTIFVGCFLIAIDEIELACDNYDEVVQYSARFSFDRMEFGFRTERKYT